MTNTPNAIDALVGRNIRFWRLDRANTVRYVASTLGISVELLAESEAGQRRFSAEELQTLCRLLSITPAEVFEERYPRLVA